LQARNHLAGEWPSRIHNEKEQKQAIRSPAPTPVRHKWCTPARKSGKNRYFENIS